MILVWGVDDETPLFLAAKVSFRVQYRLGELLKGEQIVIVFFKNCSEAGRSDSYIPILCMCMSF